MKHWAHSLPIYTECKPGYQALPFHTSFWRAVETATKNGGLLCLAPKIPSPCFVDPDAGAPIKPARHIALRLIYVRTGPNENTPGFTPVSDVDAALLNAHWNQFA